MRNVESSQSNRKKKGLASAISRIVGSIMVVVFLLLIISVSITAGRGLLDETRNSLQSIAKANGVQIQEYMNICQTTAKGLAEEIEASVAEKRSLKQGDAKLEETEKSVVYDTLGLNGVEKQLESFLISTAKSAVANNQAVIGIGIMFEPYQYTEKRESYALYFTEEDGEIGVSDVGAYEEFSANDYYQIAVGKTETIFTEPYSYRDMWMITGATPILVDGEMIGVINIDVSMSVFDELDFTNSSYPSMTASVISRDGTIDFDSGNADVISQNVSEAYFKSQAETDAVLKQIQDGQSFVRHYDSKAFGTKAYSYYYPLRAGSETWATVTSVEAKDVLKDTFLTIVLLCVLSIVCLIVIAAVTDRIIRKKLAPIGEVVDAAKRISAGYLDVQLQAVNDDEIGTLAETFQATSIFLKNMIKDISQVLGRIAQNDFTVDTAIEYDGDFVQIRESFTEILGNLNAAMQEVKSGAGQVSAGADQMAQTAQTLAADAEEQAVSVDRLNTSVREVTARIELNAKQAEDASGLAKSIGSEVEISNRKMEEMVTAISEITETSRHIEMIIQNIESIASQTNLLSLNASIEAARAGEAGRGFAVVAEEIQGLANQSAEAAQNTRRLIGESIQAVESGTAIAADTEKSMSALVEEIGGIVVSIEQIAIASREQKEAIAEIEGNVSVISDSVQNNSGASEEASATSQQLKAQADILLGRVSEFRLK